MENSRSTDVFQRNRGVIAGGTVSLNRLVEPVIVFAEGHGPYLMDVDGHRYIDYHAAFAVHLLGHHHPLVTQAVVDALSRGESLYGSGTTEREGVVGELIRACVPSMERVQFVNSGSEATYFALRLARAFTGREHVLVIQGGYNGWHDDVAVNLMTPLEQLGCVDSSDELPVVPLSAGVPRDHQRLVHVVNFNDPVAVERVLQRYDVAAVLLEPVLQNIGVVPPAPGYLESLRALCDRYGTLLIFDEVKTGFRAGLGGYQGRLGIRPDLTVLGKAVANGFPFAVVGGRAQILELVADPDPARHVFVAGTFNGHPISLAAAEATLKIVSQPGFYETLDARATALTDGIGAILRERGVPAVVSRVGSAFCVYFMDHIPRDWPDLARHHNFAADTAFRRALIARGVYVFPLSPKQWSLSAAHTTSDIDRTLEAVGDALKSSAVAEALTARP